MQDQKLVQKTIESNRHTVSAKSAQPVLANETSHLYGISFDEMRALMSLKWQARLNKNKDFNCFVTNHQEFTVLVEHLKKHLPQIPSGTRFQLAICSEKDTMGRGLANVAVDHWLLIDCFVKDNKLHTLTVDAANMRGKLDPILGVLSSQFPTGSHFYFNNRAGQIQYSDTDCQTFAREHAGILSKLDPKILFKELDFYAHQDSNSCKYFTFDDFNKGKLLSLVPLIRSIQSVKTYKKLSECVKNQLVSKKGHTLTEWINQRIMTTHVKGEDKERNVSILMKDHKYANELKSFNKCATYETKAYKYRSGLGYIALTAKINPYLQNQDKTQIKALIKEIVSVLDQTPKYRNNYLFGELFQMKAAHIDRVNETKLLYADLLLDCDKTEVNLEQIRENFKGITEYHADYLIHFNSVRNMDLLMRCINKFIALNTTMDDQKVRVSKVV